MAHLERTKRDGNERTPLSEVLRELERSSKVNDRRSEEKALALFQSKYGKTTIFSRSTEHKQFLSILRFLVRKRLLDPSANCVALSVFHCLRILLRDSSYLLTFAQENGLVGLKQQMDFYVSNLSLDLCDSNHETVHTASEALKQILNILQKLFMNTPEHAEQEYFASSQIIPSITQLLTHHQDFLLLQETLRLCLHMTDKTDFYLQELLRSEIIDTLLDLLEYKDLETTQLALHLMANVLSHTEARRSMSHLTNEFLSTFTSYLSHDNVKVLEHAIWCLASCADNEDDRKRIRFTGAIPLLLSLLEKSHRFDYTSPSANSNQRQSSSNAKKRVNENAETPSHCDQLYGMQSACCNCLAELSYNFTNGQIIVEQNGVYLLALLLFADSEEMRGRDSFQHLQRTVFKTLRFLVSVYKKHDQYQYKRLFPGQIFELFVSIGNFQRDPDAYNEITHTWNAIPIDELTKIKQGRLQSMNPRQEPTRFIEGYGVYECLGSGAFGSVYRVSQRGSANMYALKEIDNRSLGHDMNRSLGQMINEVNIIREELRHPNVVTYYRIFAENDKLYIKMELIAGSSLQDHLSLIKDTHQKLTEEQIWRVFIQLILALRYLHKEKGIVHRDITANNIMLDDEYRVKLTDFGLAKLRDTDCSKMTSFVGTMYYACPEIIQHLPYNEKADIWSLGCVLYHMVALVPPFYTSNILSLASKICESNYDGEPLKFYSDRIGQIVGNCLTINPVNRPDINGVAQLCMEQLMSYTDRSCATIQSLEKRLRHREHQRELQFIRQHPQYHQRCFSCSSAKESLVNSSNGLADVIFDGLDGQPDASRHDLNQSGAESETTDSQAKESSASNASAGIPPTTKGSNPRRQPTRIVADQSFNTVEASSVQARSSELSSISVESGYDSNNPAHAIHHSLSSSSMERKSSATSRSRQSSITGSISISNTRLRPTDPVSQLLEIVHKLIYISYVPSKMLNNKSRRLIDRYRGFLFSKSSSQNLKSELFKLSNHSNDCITFETGAGRSMVTLQSLGNSSSRSPSTSFSSLKTVDFTISESDGSVTYEQMMNFIDEILKETDYYKDPLASSEHLLSAVQRSLRPPSGKK